MSIPGLFLLSEKMVVHACEVFKKSLAPGEIQAIALAIVPLIPALASIRTKFAAAHMLAIAITDHLGIELNPDIVLQLKEIHKEAGSIIEAMVNEYFN